MSARSPLWTAPRRSSQRCSSRSGRSRRGSRSLAARSPCSLFLGTLSVLVTTPGVTAAGGFPVLSVLPGEFLLKDLVLSGASLWTLSDSLGAAWLAVSAAAPPT